MQHSKTTQKVIQRAFLAATVVVVFSACALFSDVIRFRPRSIPIGDYTYAIEYTDQLIRRTMKQLDIPSIVVALIDDQTVIWDRAYGVADLATGRAPTVDTVYKVGSITKLFTGIEIMRMYEEGLIDLDAPITTYLPDFTVRTRWPESDPITVRSILSHRSGLPRNGSLLGWYWDSIPDVLEAQTDSLADVYQAFPVGYRYKYSNIGSEVLGRLIEVVRGVDSPAEAAPGAFPYYMEQALLKPLGMTDSGFGSRALLREHYAAQEAATGYYRNNGRNVAYSQFDIIQLASANMHTTMRDMEKFVRFIFAGGETDGTRIVAGETLKMMFDVQYARPSDPQTTGLTWFTDTTQLSELVALHSGTNQGFISLLTIIPARKLGVILLSNSDEFESVHNQVAFDVLKLLLETKFGLKPPVRARPRPIAAEDEVLRSYTGTYIVNGEIIDIKMGSGGLRATYGNTTFRLEPVDETRFLLSSWFATVDDLEMTFHAADSGDTKTMILTLGDSYYITCPEYPMADEVPPLWLELEGQYQVLPRHPSVYSDSDAMGTIDIFISEGVLMTSDAKVLLPLSETQIQIVGGIFDGEIMDLDTEARSITWQNVVYRRL